MLLRAVACVRVGIACQWAALQEQWAPGTMPAGGGADLGRSHRNQLMQLSLALPLSLRDFFKPRHFTAQVLHLAGRPVSYEFKNERYFLQSWVAAEQEQWINLGLNLFAVDYLKLPFPFSNLY